MYRRLELSDVRFLYGWFMGEKLIAQLLSIVLVFLESSYMGIVCGWKPLYLCSGYETKVLKLTSTNKTDRRL